MTIAGTAGYSVGNIGVGSKFVCFITSRNLKSIFSLDLDWEQNNFFYNNEDVSPINILIRASDGASDYGNKFGEPIIAGYTRSFGAMISKLLFYISFLF